MEPRVIHDYVILPIDNFQSMGQMFTRTVLYTTLLS